MILKIGKFVVFIVREKIIRRKIMPWAQINGQWCIVEEEDGEDKSC
jgi:hypothetical protein